MLQYVRIFLVPKTPKTGHSTAGVALQMPKKGEGSLIQLAGYSLLLIEPRMQLGASAAKALWWLIFSLSSRMSGSFSGEPIPREPFFSISFCMELLCARRGIPLTLVGLHEILISSFLTAPPNLASSRNLGKIGGLFFFLMMQLHVLTVLCSLFQKTTDSLGWKVHLTVT